MNTTGMRRNGSGDWKDFNMVADEIHYLILALFIIAVNSCVIVAVWRCKCLRKSENYLLVSLSCSDMSTGLIGLPLLLVCSASALSDDCMSCYASFTFTRLLSISTILHLLAVAFERYILIVHPFYHRRFTANNVNWVKIVMVCLWLVSLIVAVVPFAWLRNDSCLKDGDSKMWLVYTTTSLIVFFLIPTVLLVYVFVSIFVVAQTHIRKQAVLIYSVVHHQEDRNVIIMRKQARVAIIFMIMWLVFLICWSPYFALSLIDELEVKINLSEWLWKGTNVLRFLTSLLNPLLYSFLKEDFHETLHLDRVVNFCHWSSFKCNRAVCLRRQSTLHNCAINTEELCLDGGGTQREEYKIYISTV